jgi:hypothetical protein
MIDKALDCVHTQRKMPQYDILEQHFTCEQQTLTGGTVQCDLFVLEAKHSWINAWHRSPPPTKRGIDESHARWGER